MRSCEVCGDTEENTRIYKSKWSNGLNVCNKHWNQYKRHGKALDDFPSRRKEERICDFCGYDKNITLYTNSNSEYAGRLVCVKHKSQITYYGKILERTKFDKNEIIILKDFAEVIIYNSKHEVVAKALRLLAFNIGVKNVIETLPPSFIWPAPKKDAKPGEFFPIPPPPKKKSND